MMSPGVTLVYLELHNAPSIACGSCATAAVVTVAPVAPLAANTRVAGLFLDVRSLTCHLLRSACRATGSLVPLLLLWLSVKS